MAEINKGVHQGCPLSPTLFNIHLNEIITNWQKEVIKGIPLPKKSSTGNTVICENQVAISNTEANLQRAAYKLKQIITIHGLITSAQKTKLVAVRG